MHHTNNRVNFLYFLVPSLLGICFFLIPFEYGGRSKIIVAHLAKGLHVYGADWWSYVMTFLLVLAAFLTLWATLWDPLWVRLYPWLGGICRVGRVWVVVRCVGAIFS